MACGFPWLFGRPPTPPPLHVRWWWSSHSPFFSRASVSFLLTWQEKMKGKKWACSSRLALGKKLFLLINFLNDSCTLAKIQMLLLCLFYFLLQHNSLRTILETNKRVAGAYVICCPSASIRNRQLTCLLEWFEEPLPFFSLFRSKLLLFHSPPIILSKLLSLESIRGE